MPNLSTLLSNRVAPTKGTEELRLGSIFYHTMIGTSGGTGSLFYPCNYCWVSPGTGCAVIELWGAAGGAAGMCCCSGGGLPGNPPAYSRKTVPVTGSSYICGWVGCSPPSASTCNNYGRAQCSVACLFNITTSNCVMMSQGGNEGVHACTTSTAGYCCLASNGFCATLLNTFCGIVCNVGGPQSACAACACGGDLNVSGGISCVEYGDCCNYYPESLRYTVAIPPGIYSTATSCVRILGHVCSPGEPSSPGMTTNRIQYLAALSGLSGSAYPTNYSYCWAGAQLCGCYDIYTCLPVAAAIPGISGFTCGGYRTSGMRGGFGAVRITYYT